MTYLPNATHDPTLRSWVTSANDPTTDFPIQNLPFGIFKPLRSTQRSTESARVGVAIGDQILNLYACQEVGLLTGLPKVIQAACRESSLNQLMGLGERAAHALRNILSQLLQVNTTQPKNELSILTPMSDAELLLPATIGDYTDFYASIFHATNVGQLFRPNNPLLPNYKHIPIAYQGRASSLAVSGTPV